ncbi:MAG TPA: alkene reductase [Dyella sp.]|uniref:alkene reductase n=1 Tax=Dyella sp. TaxID=1869338 RepID=UPI002B8F5DE9|nr:alkene reductase [Dyella sp.]HUB90351.1 alkene reductase [Dyella sp.]
MSESTAHVMHVEDLFEPIQLGPYLLANRIVMAPLTRSRATEEGVPTPLMTEYYTQRASAGLIITEGVNISAQGRGYMRTPGLYDNAQTAAWRPIVDAVHARGGRIYPQLWHVGRISHPALQPHAALPVAPSAIRPNVRVYAHDGFRHCVKPRALTTGEIYVIVEQYRQAARRALQAGFDGVEIHAANGYLIEQFLRDSTNEREDNFGGSVENRAHFLLEVVDAVTSVMGASRVGVRLSPLGFANDCSLDSDPESLYGYVVEKLNAFRVSYIHVIEGTPQGPRDVFGGFDLQLLRRMFKGRYIANNGYDLGMAQDACRRHRADMVSFGRAYIANPDLVERFKRSAPLNTPDHSTFFGGGAKGYTDYPCLSAKVGTAS